MKKENCPGSLKKLISNVKEEFSLPNETIKRNTIHTHIARNSLALKHYSTLSLLSDIKNILV